MAKNTKDNVFLSGCKYDAEKYKKDQLRNFLEETKEIIAKNGALITDVKWVGDVDGNICMSWAEFERQVRGFVYYPRGRCGYLTQKSGEKVSYFDDEKGVMNRIPPDLIVSGTDFFLRRFIHLRVSEQEQPRTTSGLYNESPEFWEFVKLPKRNSPYLVDNANVLRLFATDNIPMARNLVTLNADRGDGDPEFVRFDDMDRNIIKAKRTTNAPKRNIGVGF